MEIGIIFVGTGEIKCANMCDWVWMKWLLKKSNIVILFKKKWTFQVYALF